MARFVNIAAADGGHYPVNPDLVAYLRPSGKGLVGIVFGAVTGGLHELLVAGPVEAVLAQLEGRAEPVSSNSTAPAGVGGDGTAPGRAPAPPAAPRGRRAARAQPDNPDPPARLGERA